MIESAISAACEEMASEIAENLRLQKLKDAENEISQENLVRPSELLAQQRRNRKSPPKEISKPTQKLSAQNPQPTQNEATKSSIEKLETELEASTPTQEEPSNIPVTPPTKTDTNENTRDSEIEISEEIPKSEAEIPSSNEVHPAEKDNSDKEVENTSPPEVINEQSPAVIKSTKDESPSDLKNSSQSSMTTSIQGKLF